MNKDKEIKELKAERDFYKDLARQYSKLVASLIASELNH